jgi:selenide,water dikinase
MAGAITVGGHTIDDPEPKYGLSVLGVADPEKVVRNSTARPGDVLFLTKPIGTGILATALKRELETEDSIRAVIESMAALNRGACEAMMRVGVDAATDVTGFGLLGHLHEMLEGSGCSAELDLAAVPVFEGALEHSAAGVRPGRTQDVIEYAAAFSDWRSDAVEDTWMGVLCDPQTSGGLLIAVPEERASALAGALSEATAVSARIGRVGEGPAGRIGVV